VLVDTYNAVIICDAGYIVIVLTRMRCLFFVYIVYSMRLTYGFCCDASDLSVYRYKNRVFCYFLIYCFINVNVVFGPAVSILYVLDHK
jgi:hypothetical protein